MGAASSKAAKTAVQASKRQYPTRIPTVPASKASTPGPAPAAAETSSAPSSQGPQVHTPVAANEHKTEAIARDSFDPQFGAALRSLGPVRPTPTQSNSSTVAAQPAFTNDGLGSAGASTGQPVFPDPKKNPALVVLDARRRFAELADQELEQYGRKGFPGKQLLDVSVIRQILVMRDQQGRSDEEIERSLELFPGIVGKLAPGVFAAPDTAGKNADG